MNPNMLSGVQTSICPLSLLHEPTDVIKTTKVKVAASRTAICPSHKINCTLKFSINAGGKKRQKQPRAQWYQSD